MRCQENNAMIVTVNTPTAEESSSPSPFIKVLLMWVKCCNCYNKTLVILFDVGIIIITNEKRATQLRSGRYQNVDEFLDEALSAWKHNEAEGFDLAKGPGGRREHPRVAARRYHWWLEN
jgi:hypothetical protein